jgi:hypothetical protein
MAPWAQDPLEAASAVCGAAPWASRLQMLGGWRRQYTWGSCTRATRGHSRRRVPQVRSPKAFTNRQLLFVKHWCNQQRFGVVLIVDLPLHAQRCWRAAHDSTGQQQQRTIQTCT